MQQAPSASNGQHILPRRRHEAALGKQKASRGGSAGHKARSWNGLPGVWQEWEVSWMEPKSVISGALAWRGSQEKGRVKTWGFRLPGWQQAFRFTLKNPHPCPDGLDLRCTHRGSAQNLLPRDEWTLFPAVSHLLSSLEKIIHYSSHPFIGKSNACS